jgi:pyridoxal phosphate enzyme (YggS family)
MLFPELIDRVADVKARVDAAAKRGGHGQKVTIVAVTKTHGPETVEAAYEAGLADIGENRVQEALTKMDAVVTPVRWHLIGHLQRNKVKSLDRFTLFHALDSMRLAEAINSFGLDRGGPVDALVQVNPASEETKGGFGTGEAREMEELAENLRHMPGIRVRGATVVAPINADERILREVFAETRRMRQVLADAGHPATELSMGMSNDFDIAVEEGATMVRVGSALFGARE